MRQRMVFVLLESGQVSPIGVFGSPCKPYLLPADAVLVSKQDLERPHYTHREIVGRWQSESMGTFFDLVAYVLQNNSD